MEYLFAGLVGFAIGAAFQRLVYELARWRWISKRPNSPQRQYKGAPEPPYSLPVPPKHSKKFDTTD